MDRLDTAAFGAFIAECRKNKKLTQKQLAQKLYVSDKAVSKWERGLCFPDIALLEPLAAALDLSLVELVDRHKSNEAEIPADIAVRDSLELSAQILKRHIRRRKILLLSLVIVSMIAIGALGMFYHYCIAVYPGALPLSVTSGYVSDGDVSSWTKRFPAHSSYALGFNANGQPVFKDPAAALKQVRTDASDAIAYLRKNYDLMPFNRFTLMTYAVYGWQIPEDQDYIFSQGQLLTAFFDIYENSFDHISA